MKFTKFLRSDQAFFSVILCILVLSAGGHIVQGDEETMYRVTQNIVEWRGLAVGREEIVLPSQAPLFHPDTNEVVVTTSAVVGRGGFAYSKYGIGQSLVSIPLYILGGFWGYQRESNEMIPAGWYARLWTSMVNPLALAGCGWLAVSLSRAIGFSKNTSRWLAVTIIFSTMLWPYVKTFYSQPSVTLLVLAGIYSALLWRKTGSRSYLWWFSAAGGVAVLFRISAVILFPAFIFYLGFFSPKKRRWNWVIPTLVCLGIALGLTAAYNWIRFGSICTSGYSEITWATPPIYGLYGLLFSSGKGIVFYAPVLVLSVVASIEFARNHREEAMLFLGLWITYLVFYSGHNYWTGGFNWGPRFLMPVVPLGIIPVGSLLESEKIKGGKLIFAIFLIVGIAVQLSVILVDHSRFLYGHLSGKDISTAYTQTVEDIEYSPVMNQWPVVFELFDSYTTPGTWDNARSSLQNITSTALNVKNGKALLVSEFLRRNTPDFWWVHLLLFTTNK